MALVKLGYQDVGLARRAAREFKLMGYDAISLTQRTYEASDVEYEYPIHTGVVWVDVIGFVDVDAMTPTRYAMSVDHFPNTFDIPYRLEEKLAASQLALLNWQSSDAKWNQIVEYARHGRWHWRRATTRTRHYVHIVVERSESYDMYDAQTVIYRRIRMY